MTSSYKYDKNGNRLSGSTLGTGASIPYNYTYQYDTANQLKQVNSSTCTNDGNGNQTGCGTSYKETYNPRNQTTSMSSPNGALNDQYVGANSNERVQTTGTNAASYTYNALGLGTEKNGSNLIAYTRDNKGNLVSERTSGGNYYYLFDSLGSVVALMPPSAVGTINAYVYDAYGVTQHQTGTQYNPWQFASGYFDASTLYYKFGTRYYDRFGRWTQKDPVASANPYTYANDDPVNEVDPSGRSCTPIELIGFVLLAVSVGGLAAISIAAILPALTAATSLAAILGVVFTTQGGLTAFFSLIGVAGAAVFIGTCLVPILHGES
jgi:RHS repeat-associated protein